MNQLSEDFGKRFVLQQELSAEQAFWFHMSTLSLNFLSHHLSKWKLPMNFLSEDLGKLNAKPDIGIFVGYGLAKNAFRIYNRRTRKIIETIHVTFDELVAMASKQFGSGPGHQLMTLATSVQDSFQTLFLNNIVIHQKQEWDHLFQPMFDKYSNPSTIAVSPVPVAAAPRAVDIADSLVSMSIDQDAPPTSIP
nr:retrovirus-related Pol polyprotein from transposon TNT 1-94 [Tanacetum cinerariifolium]